MNEKTTIDSPINLRNVLDYLDVLQSDLENLESNIDTLCDNIFLGSRIVSPDHENVKAGATNLNIFESMHQKIETIQLISLKCEREINKINEITGE